MRAPGTADLIDSDRGRPRQRLFLVPHSRPCLQGLPPALLLPDLRRLGRLGGRRGSPRAPPLRAQAARDPSDVGGAARARGSGACASRHARRLRALRGGADRGHRAADARGVARLPGRHLPRVPEAHGALRARVRRAHPGRRVAGPPRPCRPLPAQLLPAAPPGRDQAGSRGPLVLHREHRLLRLRRHARLRCPGLRLLERRGPPSARGLEDRRQRRRGRGDPAWRLRALCAGGHGRGSPARGSARGQPRGGQGDRASLERGEPGPRARAHPPLRARDARLPQGPGQEPRRGGELREERGFAHLPMVQLPGGLPARAAAVLETGRHGGSGAASPGNRTTLVKALLVDLDDTLLDYSGGVEDSWRSACQALATTAGVDAVALADAVRIERRRFWDDVSRHRIERVNMMGAWPKTAANGLERMGAPSPELAARIAEDFAARRWAVMRLFPGVPEALGRLCAAGVPMALVTNGDKTQQRRKIETYDLARFFEVIVIEGEFGAGKPEEIVYRHALERLGIAAAEAWMVGDHIEWDVAAPQRLGLRGIWVDRDRTGLPEGTAVRPHRIVREFCELLDPTPSP